MPTECVVPGCISRTGGHSFPFANSSQLKQWMVAIKRDKWKPTRHSVVCKAHFTADDYEEKTTYGTTPLCRRLKRTAVPSVFSWNKPKTPCAIKRSERAKRRLDFDEQAKEQRLSALYLIGREEEVREEDNEDIGEKLKDTSVQTETIHTACTYTQSEPGSSFSAKKFIFDSAGFHFYTGLDNYEKFLFVLDTLGPAAYELSYYYNVIPSLPVEDQFFLTLIKLRQHKTNFEISRMFDIHEATVTNIFITWINFMALQWDELNWWPSSELVHFFAPTDFKRKFPTTRVIIDGTECPIKKPKEPVAQQATYSTYKNKNTVKVLVGASPGGLVSYVSPAYCGSTSDRQICERSDLMQMCDAGDSIMADKGFNVQDLFEANMVHINIPTFFKKTNRLSGEVVLKDRKIASKRVHIERLIGLAKTYKILKEPMHHTESVLASQIIKVCFYLCNFRANIVPKHA